MSSSVLASQTTTPTLIVPDAPSNEADRRMLYDTYMAEYTALKNEQSARIGFRDNLLYVQLATVGAVFAFSTARDSYADSLLVVPWICVILGWTYLANDHHISRIGKYVREDLSLRMLHSFNWPSTAIFTWEPYHRADKLKDSAGIDKLRAREPRKHVQLAIDLLTFVASGFVALFVFHSKSGILARLEVMLLLLETLALTLLAVAFWVYADVGSSNTPKLPDPFDTNVETQ